MNPRIVAISGPNGAGKSTCAPALLKDTLGVMEFINADLIARGLSGFSEEAQAIRAGRLLLQRIRALSDNHLDFAFETTLSGLAYARWISEQIERDYEFHIIFLSLASPDLAVNRVAERIRLGGHSVPETVIRRRFRRGLDNFFQKYCPLATTWNFYDNSMKDGPRLIARGGMDVKTILLEPDIWMPIQERYRR